MSKRLLRFITIIGFSALLAGKAVADDSVFHAATLQSVSDKYQLTLQDGSGKAGAVYLLSSLNLFNLHGIQCDTDYCESNTVVHGFFATPRQVKFFFKVARPPEPESTPQPAQYQRSNDPAYAAGWAAAEGIRSLFKKKPNVPEHVPDGVTLVSSADQNDLFRTLAQAYPGALDAPIATIAGHPTFWHYVKGECSATRLEVTSDVEESAYQSQEAACDLQRDTELKAAAIASQKLQQVKARAEDLAAARRAKAEHEQERIAAAIQQRNDANAARIAAQERITQLVTARRDERAYADKCISKLDLNSCAIGEMTAWTVYDGDKASNPGGQCKDEAAIVILSLYRIQLTTVYLTSNDIFRIDRTLGNLIDNCPDQASWHLV